MKEIFYLIMTNLYIYKLNRNILNDIVERFCIVYDLLKDDKTNNDLIIEYVDGLKLLSYNYFEYEEYHNDIHHTKKTDINIYKNLIMEIIIFIIFIT